MSTLPRHARREATSLLDDHLVARVLEPSPPAVNEEPWFADHPVELGSDDPARVVSPVGNSMISWDDVSADHPEVARFARDHWLGNFKPLSPAPDSLTSTRLALGALAFYVLSPVRQQANGKIALRWTKGGFGTPFFDDDRQVRVEGTRLVLQDGDEVVSQPITTLRAAGEQLGVQPEGPVGIDFHDPPTAFGPDEELAVDPDAVAFLDDWFGFATLVLETLHVRAGSPDDTRVQLWTEHFDPAIELGDASAGSRASYGASPGDSAIDQPYLYVAPWNPRQGDFWSAPFGGAAMNLGELRASDSAVDAAVEFFERGRALLS